MTRLRGLIVLDERSQELIYGPDEILDISRRIELLASPLTPGALKKRPELLAKADLLFTGWGGPRLDTGFLAHAPMLKALFHGAGSLASIVTDAVWERGIVVTTAIDANAVPVAEYALASIIFSLKHGWHHMQQVRLHRTYGDRNLVPGCYQSTVGLISLGRIGRILLDLLHHLSVKVIVYDPFLSPKEAQRLGVERVSLAELFARSDVVSLHAPALEETTGMVTGKLLASLKSGATFINTARAELVRQDELIEVAEERPDLQFVLDVVHPEPPPPESALYDLPNVVLTPHLAGSAGRECRRMGRYIVDELDRYLADEPLHGAVTAEKIWNTSHRPFYAADGSERKLKPEEALFAPAT